MRWERNDRGRFDDRPIFDKVSPVLRTFSPMETGSKCIEKRGWAEAIHPAHLFRLIHANGEMDSFDMGTVDFNDSLSEWQIRFEYSSYSCHCQISHMSLSSPPVSYAKGQFDNKSVFSGRGDFNLWNRFELLKKFGYLFFYIVRGH